MSRFLIISLGPGKPELITLQALQALKECEKIFVQTRSKELTWKGSVSYRILESIIINYPEWFEILSSKKEYPEFIKDKLVPIYTPMSYDRKAWDQQIAQILEAYEKCTAVGYVTLGDAGVHSSAYYLLEFIKDRAPEVYHNTEVIPGITSYSYAAAKVKKPLCLGNTLLEVIPKQLEKANTTKVYMRLHKGNNIEELNGHQLCTFKNLGLENEEVYQGKPDVIDNYLTLIIDFATPDIPETEER
jgi:precorrin-2/cobalt-factor-2 C20-methyltransferase